MVRAPRSMLLLGLLTLVACGDDDGPTLPPLPAGDRLNLRLSAVDFGAGMELVDGEPAPV